MSKNDTPIVKAEGVNDSEKLLAQLCDKVFLKLWAYANPQKQKGRELCDVLAVFENHVFIFSDKNISFKAERTTTTDFEKWKSWKSEAIDKSIYQIKKAEKWIRKNPEKIFLDSKCTVPLPLTIDKDNIKVHRIIVAHGAEEACKNDSPDNISGSLAIIYADLENSGKNSETIGVFNVTLPRDEITHVFDSHNLEIILGELDTVQDLLSYFEAKEEAVKKYDFLQYCGEEDLLANYFLNFDKKLKRHYIGTKEKISNILIGEGEWQDFINGDSYKMKKQADKISYSWDDLLQKTFQNALDGTLISDGDVFKGETALIEMAKEPRVSRRDISERMLNAVSDFSDDTNQMRRHVGSYQSFYSDRRYAFLILSRPSNMDYETEYLPMRRDFLKLSCGLVKNKFPHLKKVIGIAIEPPKPNQDMSEDFALLDCENWTEYDVQFFKEANKETGLNFFETDKLKVGWGKVSEFPDAPNNDIKTKPERNESCPCGSGKKYKKCCYMRGF